VTRLTELLLVLLEAGGKLRWVLGGGKSHRALGGGGQLVTCRGKSFSFVCAKRDHPMCACEHSADVYTSDSRI
jgi:hypothetical protein